MTFHYNHAYVILVACKIILWKVKKIAFTLSLDSIMYLVMEEEDLNKT